MQRTNENQEINTKSKSKKKLFSRLAIVLLICILELAFGSIQNLCKTISFQAKIKGLENKRNEELSRNKQLKSEIENYNSDMILESIARNNLKMAGEDEVLLILDTPKEEPQQKVKDKKNKSTKNRP